MPVEPIQPFGKVGERGSAQVEGKRPSALQTAWQATGSRARTKGLLLEPNELAHAIVGAAADKKATNIVLLDLRQIALIADYFVICSGQSVRQLRAIVKDVIKAIKDLGQYPRFVEGSPESGWVLIDFGAVVVHVFSPELRSYYALEQLWREAPVVVHMQ